VGVHAWRYVAIKEPIAVLRNDINSALKQAMKAKNERCVATLRLVIAAITNADIEAQMHGQAMLPDNEIQMLLQKMIKQRQESAEREEIEIIRAYLPQQISRTELEALIASTIGDVSAQSMRDMGKVMAALRQNHAGRIDFAQASTIVKAKLAP
jgi:uncharacterized protein YqeY